MHYAYSLDRKEANKQRPRSLRILQVVASMNLGGIETWLKQILHHIDRDRFQIDFLVHTSQPGKHDDEIRALGSQIISCPYLSQPWLYPFQFLQILRKYGPYDIVHSHIHHFNGYILRLAHHAGIPVRIAHSHSDTSAKDTQASWYRRWYLDVMQMSIANHATKGLATTTEAAAVLSGSFTNPPWQILNCGIDLTPFLDAVDPVAVRTELGIPVDTFVIGHIGRFVKVKNHSFILDIIAEVAKKEPKICLLLVGDGILRPEIEQKVAHLGLTDRVIFAGVRSDIPRLMRGAMDLLLFPSLYEGMGNVRLEAQAAGLPSIVSDVVPEAGDIVKPLVQRISLSQPASTWAEAILATRKTEPGITQAEALKLVEMSPFNILTSVKELEKIYIQESASKLFLSVN
ncbi:group 1 glycosyl transferase [Cylindrospermum sp. NIES-4074]|nr:group 1 glycosyl transferase [Cylindrospermum sp. NIES-4074]